jgi:hypothetical protein
MVMSKTEYFRMRLEDEADTENPAMSPTIGQKLNNLTTSLGTSLESLKGHLDTLFGNIFTLGEAISQKATDVSMTMSAFKDFVKEKIGELADYVTTFYKNTMKPALNAVTKPARDAFNKAMESIKTHMKDASDSVAGIYLGAKRGMGKSLKNVGEKLKNAGLSSSGEKLKDTGNAMEESANDAKEVRSINATLRRDNKKLRNLDVAQAADTLKTAGASMKDIAEEKKGTRVVKRFLKQHKIQNTKIKKGRDDGPSYDGF